MKDFALVLLEKLKAEMHWFGLGPTCGGQRVQMICKLHNWVIMTKEAEILKGIVYSTKT